MALGAPTFLIYGFGVFIDPLAGAFDTGRGAVSLALTLGLIGYMLVGPFVGALADRYGPRRLILWGVIAEVAILAVHGSMQTVLHFYLAAFFLVVLGSGTGPVTYARIISSWFDRKRGFALGITLTGIGIGGAVLPVLGQFLISEFGWRNAYRSLAVIVLAISFLPLFLFARDRPGDAVDGASASEPSSSEPGVTLKEAVATPTFWLIGIGFMLFAAGNTGGLVHMPPILTDSGLSPERAAAFTGLLGLGVIVGRISAGYLLDIFHAPYVAIAFLAGPLCAYGYFLGDLPAAWAFVPVVLFGIGMGAEFDVIPFLVTRYFGLRNFGAVYGVLIAGFSIGSAFGPAMMGFGFDRFGSYGPSMMAAIVLLVLGSLLVSRLGSYRFA